MPTSRKKPTSTLLERAREALDQATLHKGDTITITDYADGGLHIEIVIHKQEDRHKKWARVADEMHERSPRKGKSTLVTDGVHAFGDNVYFERE